MNGRGDLVLRPWPHCPSAASEAAFGLCGKLGSRCMMKEAELGAPGRKKVLGRAWRQRAWLVGWRCPHILPASVCLCSKRCLMPVRGAGLVAGLATALTRGAAKLAGPWNVTLARLCGLAPLPGEGANPARSRGLGAAQIWLPLSSNGSPVRSAPGHGRAIVRGVDMEWTSREVPQMRGHETAAFQRGPHVRPGPRPADPDHAVVLQTRG